MFKLTNTIRVSCQYNKISWILNIKSFGSKGHFWQRILNVRVYFDCFLFDQLYWLKHTTEIIHSKLLTCLEQSSSFLLMSCFMACPTRFSATLPSGGRLAYALTKWIVARQHITKMAGNVYGLTCQVMHDIIIMRKPKGCPRPVKYLDLTITSY